MAGGEASEKLNCSGLPLLLLRSSVKMQLMQVIHKVRPVIAYNAQTLSTPNITGISLEFAGKSADSTVPA